MSNKKLGIDVEIKYPSATQIKNSLNAEWQKVKEKYDLKVNVVADKNSLKSMRKKIQDFLQTADFDFELHINSVKAISEMGKIRREVEKLRQATEDEIEIKFSGVKQQTKDLKDLATTVDNNNKKNEKTDSGRMSRLREIMSIQKEMNSLQSKQVGAGSQQQAIYNKRIEELAVHLQLAKNEYKDMFGSNADSEWMVNNVKRVGEMNVELKQAQQTQKETNEMVKQYTGLLNEEFRIQKELQSSGENQSKVLQDQLVKIREKKTHLETNQNLTERMTDAQKEATESLQQQNQYQLRLTEAKKQDAELAKRQKETYRDLKTDLTEMYKIQMQIADLQAKYDAGIATGKEEDLLNSLQQQLMVRKDIHNSAREQASSEGLINKEAEEGLDTLKRQQDGKRKIAEETAKLNADLKVTNKHYDELMSSVRRVQALTKDLASAGSREADVIRKTIRAEEDKQAEIKETLKQQNRVNDAREEEYATMKRVNSQQEELNAERSVANQSDQYRQNSIIGMFDPRTVYNDGKQVAMEIFDVVSTLDKQLVNIEKVADASEAEMDRFKENVFDFATDVGKSSDEYAESVERWVTQGFTLTEGMSMARQSTMGAFVGNVGEAEMVDYMSVPLISYKDTALEINDILNVMNEVANNNAIEMDDLGQAYKRAANTASTAGTSFAELTGLVTGAQEGTRFGGEVIGTSMRQLDMNFGKIASQLTKADETKFAFFKKIGVQVTDANGELRSTFDIIDDLQGAWGELSSTDRVTASQYAGGARHATVLQAIIKNWDTVMKVQGEATGEMALFDKESGSAYQEFAKQSESVEFAVAGLKNAWAEFIYEISGGRDGVKMVVDQLRQLLDVAITLAKNDAFMGLAKTFLKATMWLTASIAIGKVFNAFKGGLLDIGSTIGIVAPKIGGLFGSLSAGGGVAKGFSGAFGIAKLALGKFIPIVTAVIAVMALLDIMGIDVIGTFKSIANGSFDLSDAIKDYQKVYKETSKTIQENSLMNREFDEVNELIKTYKELNKEKEKTAKKNKKPVTYNAEEFATLRDEFNAQAELLDLDLRITFNDYDHIKKQLDELERQKNLLEVASADELISNIRERNALPDNQYTYDADFEKQRAEIEKKIKNRSHRGTAGAEIYEKELAELTKTSRQYTDNLFKSADFQEQAKARQELMVEAKKTRDDLVKIHEDLNPADFGTEGSFFVGQEMLPALKEMTSHTSDLNGLGEALKNNGTLTKEQSRLVASLVPEYANIPTAIATWSDAEREAVATAITGQKELNQETSDSVESRIRALLKYGGAEDEEIDSAVARMKGTQQEVISIMAEMGETGRLALGVSSEALAMYGDDWSNVMIAMQNRIDGLDEEKVFQYKLVTEDGYFNWEVLDMITEIPEEVVTKYELMDENGIPQIENLVEMFDNIPEEVLTKYNLLDENSEISIDKIKERLAELPPEEIVEIFANAEPFMEEAQTVLNKSDEVDGKKPVTTFIGNASPFNFLVGGVIQDINEVDSKEAEPSFSGNKTEYDATSRNVLANLNVVDGETATPKFEGDTRGFMARNEEVDREVARERSIKVNFIAKFANGVKEWWNKLRGGGADVTTGASTLESVGITPSIGGALASGTSQSVGITPNIGEALARGASQSVSVGQATSYSTNSRVGGNPRYADTAKNDARVDTEVWRYWAKEMFKGLPLENSMDNLNRSITNANDDNKKLIKLYNQQIKLISQQVDYEKSMKKAQQSEMSSLLSQLRKQGFKTSGNQITNLGISKNMKGEKATKANDLLSQWKTLYQALDTTNDKINQLNQEKLDVKNSIKDAQEAIRLEAIEKELKTIEKTLKRSEAMLKNIGNDMNIFSTKIGLISDSDYELKLSITEEGVNKASQNVKTLTDEFNKLSKTTVKYEENAGNIQSELESLKSEILNNADSIIEYRNAMKSLELDRMASDFDKFAQTIEGNLGRINNNIDNMRDGLLSGQKLSDLDSSSLVGLDFTRKTKIEKEFEQRLALERELNEALDAFAKKNIDRVKNVATATLTVEKSKYTELLKLANGFSNGKIESVSIAPSKSVGSTKADTSKDKEYQAWLTNLASINNAYVKAYNSMVSKYDNAMSKAKTTAEKEMITNAMIIEQLKLQEDIYKSMITSNNKAIKNTQDMLKDSSLTTEQREQLLANIEEYGQSNISAQNSIKDSIQSRFDLEFELIDEAIAKAQEYTDELNHMMSIAEAVNSGNDVMSELYRTLYESKINEFANATSIIKELAKQQAKFQQGSFEWTLLQNKITETQDSLSDLTLDILNANKDILSSQLDIIQEANEKMALGGMNAEEFDKFKDAWMEGIEKELELEKLRMKLSAMEDKTLQGKLELMDRQEKVSRAELEYIDKQMEAVRLQEKLENIRGERNVQTLAQDSNGNWQWEYVADQAEHDSTKEELDSVNLELAKYREDQRRAYVTEMNDIIDKVREGNYKDVASLEKAIANVNDMFDDILVDIKDMSLYDTASIIKAYQDYTANNRDIVSGVTNGGGFKDTVNEIGKTFEQSFINVTTDLTKLIADELKHALNATPVKGNGGIVIEKQILEFPNVKDSSGLEEAFRELPQIAKQISTAK